MQGIHGSQNKKAVSNRHGYHAVAKHEVSITSLLDAQLSGATLLLEALTMNRGNLLLGMHRYSGLIRVHLAAHGGFYSSGTARGFHPTSPNTSMLIIVDAQRGYAPSSPVGQQFCQSYIHVCLMCIKLAALCIAHVSRLLHARLSPAGLLREQLLVLLDVLLVELGAAHLNHDGLDLRALQRALDR